MEIEVKCTAQSESAYNRLYNICDNTNVRAAAAKDPIIAFVHSAVVKRIDGVR